MFGALTEEQIEFLVLAEKRAKSSAKACDAMRAYLDVINGLPEKERPRTFRAINAAE